MTLPTSGALSRTSIQSEMGGSNPIGLNEYYVGGSIVPYTSRNANIAISGAIDANGFYGAQGFTGQFGEFVCGSTGGKVSTNGFFYTAQGTRAYTNSSVSSGFANYNRKCILFECSEFGGTTTISMIVNSPSTFVGGSTGAPGQMALRNVNTGSIVLNQNPTGYSTQVQNASWMRGCTSQTFTTNASWNSQIGNTYQQFWN